MESPSSPSSRAHRRPRPNVTRRDVLAAALAALFATPGLRATPMAAALPLMRDRAGRLLLDVHLDDRGPFRFLLDTGATVSGVSEFLAAELRLPAAGLTDAAVLGATGGILLQRVRARELRAGRLHVARPVLARLPAADRLGAGVDGVLGADLLLAGRAMLRLSLHSAQVSLAGAADGGGGEDLPASAACAAPQPVRVVGRKGPLLAVHGRFLAHATRAVSVAAILDTGAQRSVGNMALCDALRLDRGSSTKAVVRGVGGQDLAALQIHSPPLRVGSARLAERALLYADLPVFAAWGWKRRPALLLGMDLLSGLSCLSIDYRRSSVAVAPARDPAPAATSGPTPAPDVA